MELWDFIITGTAAYGPQTPGKSDIDIVLMEEDAQELIDILADWRIHWHKEIEGYPAGTFYFQLGGLRFNIIQVANWVDFVRWRARTERMKRLNPIADRAERLEIFNQEVLP